MMLYYNIICRNCLSLYDFDFACILQSSNMDEFYSETEFTYMVKLEEWRKEDENKCEKCSSENIEVFNIRAENYKLFSENTISRRCMNTNERMLTLIIKKIIEIWISKWDLLPEIQLLNLF